MNEDINVLATLIAFVITLIVIFAFLITPFSAISCNQKYEDSKYKIFGGCLVKYNNKYIPEKLYEKSFEQNLNINK